MMVLSTVLLVNYVSLAQVVTTAKPERRLLLERGHLRQAQLVIRNPSQRSQAAGPQFYPCQL